MAIALRNSYVYAEDDNDWVSIFANDAGAKWVAGDYVGALNSLIAAVQRAHLCFDDILSKYSETSPYYRLCRLHQLSWEYTMAEPPEFELTWKAICEAWVKNDFEGKEWTIAIIDHMRKLMWDKPFYIQWAASPTGETT
jgi:hypothetical protein